MLKTIAVTILIAVLAPGDAPDWVKNLGKSAQYPEQAYLVGFGMDKSGKEKDKGKSLQRAIDVARANLIQKIRVKIQSTSTGQTEEAGNKISSYFSSVTQSSSSLELQGVEVQTFYDDDEELSYALAFVNREKLLDLYRSRSNNVKREIRQHLDAGKRYEEQGARTRALDEYLACYPLFRQLEEAQAIVAAARTRLTEIFDELEGEVTKEELTVAQVREAVNRLIERPQNNAEDLAWHLAYMLKPQLEAGKSVLVVPFTYHDTRMGSPFARYFKDLLESKLVEVTRCEIVQHSASTRVTGRDVAREYAESAGAQLVLSGTYWEQPEGIKFISTLRQVKDGKIVGGAESLVKDSVVENTRLSLKPENFAQALIDQKQFNQDEVIGGGLQLEVWTNKGTENLVFAKGERMQVYVRVNLPSYIRFLYHLADGRRTLLLDNYYIDESKVNLLYQIPEEFECDEPYGAEFLQAFARTEKFEPVDTEKVDGYDILKEDLGKFLAQQRGMKKAKQGTLQTETRVVVTTMKE